LEQIFQQMLAEGSPKNGFTPRTDVWEEPGHFRLEMELPGFRREEIQIRIEQNLLIIESHLEANAPQPEAPSEATDPAPENTPKTRVVLRERQPKREFQRSFRLGTQVITEGIEAHLQDGVLTVVLPKQAKPQPVQIEVRTAPTAVLV
jgi:HSP20 family protein